MSLQKNASKSSKIATGIKFTIVGTLMWLSAISSSLATAAKTATNNLPKSLEQKVQSFQSKLLAQGYEVAQGDVHLFTIEDCKYAIQSIGNCLGNNPTAPYIIPTVPLWSDEYADDHMMDILGPVDGKRVGWSYRLDEKEALVVLALLPPTGRYFGIQPYIFSREAEINTSDQLYQSVTDPFMKSILFMRSPNPNRSLVFSSIGDSINNVVIEKKSKSAFDEQRFFVITSDANLGRKLSDVLLQSGVPDKNHIFTSPIPQSLAKLGLGSSSDDFMTLIRYAMPKDELAGEKWRHQLPMAVFRVRLTDPSHVAEPYPMPARETRFVRSELNLKSKLDDLILALKLKWGQTEALQSQFQSLLLSVDLIGEHCLRRPMNCLGDTADADYQISQTAAIDNGEVIAVAGTLGTATGNATYTSLAVNRIPELVGVYNLSDIDLAGTANAFQSIMGDTDKFYVTYFARDCRGIANCHAISEQMVPHGGSLKLIQRNYIVPDSNRGPAPDGLVNPHMIIFNK